MAGWSCSDRETIEWNGTIKVRNNLKVLGLGNSYFLGNVGIGTTNPGAKLDVIGVIGNLSLANLGLKAPSTAQGQKVGITFYPTFENTPADNGSRRAVDIIGGFNGGVWGTEYLSFNVGMGGAANDAQNLTIERMRIAGNGNVGIGTTAPVDNLHIAGTFTPSIVTGNNNGGAISLGPSGGSTAPTGAIETSWGGAAVPQIGIGVVRDSLRANILMDYNNNIYLRQGTSSKITVDGATGNVGIGTTSPSAILSTSGVSQQSFGINTSLNLNGQIFLDGGTTGIGSGGGVLFGAFSKPFANIRGYIYDANNNANGALVFSTRGATTETNLTPNMIITGGNVGIGTTSPAEKLSVVGSINQTGALSCGLSSDASGKIICTSDERLKNILGNSTYGLNQIMNITPIKFEFKNETYVHVGFSAQNIQKVIPEATPLQTDGYLGLDTNAITATIVNAMQEQQKIIIQQNETINAMKQSLCELGKREWCM